MTISWPLDLFLAAFVPGSVTMKGSGMDGLCSRRRTSSLGNLTIRSSSLLYEESGATCSEGRRKSEVLHILSLPGVLNALLPPPPFTPERCLLPHLAFVPSFPLPTHREFLLDSESRTGRTRINPSVRFPHCRPGDGPEEQGDLLHRRAAERGWRLCPTFSQAPRPAAVPALPAQSAGVL